MSGPPGSTTSPRRWSSRARRPSPTRRRVRGRRRRGAGQGAPASRSTRRAPRACWSGQSAACDVRLTDRQVSRRHVALDVTDEGLRAHRSRLHATARSSAACASPRRTWRGGEIVRLGRDGAAPRARAVVGHGPSRRTATRRSGAMHRREPRDAPPLPALRAPGAERGPRRHRGRDRDRQGGARRGAPPGERARARRRSWSSTAPRCRRRCSSRSSSATSAARSPARCRSGAGVFEQAHGGTLFIDEIGDLELDAPAQAPARDRARRGAARRRRARGSASTCASSPRRAATSTARCRRGASATTCSSASRSRASSCRRCGAGAATSPCWRGTSGAARAAQAVPCPRASSSGSRIRLAGQRARAPQRHRAARRARRAARRCARGPRRRRVAAMLVERVLRQDLPLPRARAEVVEEFERRYVERVLERARRERLARRRGVGDRAPVLPAAQGPSLDALSARRTRRRRLFAYLPLRATLHAACKRLWRRSNEKPSGCGGGSGAHLRVRAGVFFEPGRQRRPRREQRQQQRREQRRRERRRQRGRQRGKQRRRERQAAAGAAAGAAAAAGAEQQRGGAGQQRRQQREQQREQQRRRCQRAHLRRDDGQGLRERHRLPRGGGSRRQQVLDQLHLLPRRHVSSRPPSASAEQLRSWHRRQPALLRRAGRVDLAGRVPRDGHRRPGRLPAAVRLRDRRQPRDRVPGQGHVLRGGLQLHPQRRRRAASDTASAAAPWTRTARPAASARRTRACA